jgi:hypothetical protein
MRPQELRIGNYILRYGKINKVTAGHLAIMTGIFVPLPEDIFTPVIITDKILFKLGFIYDKGIYRIGHEGGFDHIKFSFSLEDKMLHYFRWDIKARIQIEYLHQLQNIYFDLTLGDELLLKNGITEFTLIKERWKNFLIKRFSKHKTIYEAGRHDA